MTDTLKHTDHSKVTEVRLTEQPSYGQTASGYGRKFPTSGQVKYDGRWRRVYVMVYGNSGSAYIVVNGEEHFLDLDTEHDLDDLIRGVKA